MPTEALMVTTSVEDINRPGRLVNHSSNCLSPSSRGTKLQQRPDEDLANHRQ
jgi:hypothetical protein